MEFAVGSWGWEHPEWDGAFYPGDIPPDWRLNYYANEFSAVAVPTAMWRHAGNIQGWIEDTPDSFRFWPVLDGGEADDPSVPEALESLVRRLGPRCAGLLVEDNDKVSADLLAGRCPAMPMWRMSRSQADGAVGAETGSGTVRWCWPWSGAAPGTPVGILTAEPRELPALRDQIEAFLDAAGDVRLATLLFRGDGPDIALLRNSAVIGDLLADRV